jgi:hypothetical protein
MSIQRGRKEGTIIERGRIEGISGIHNEQERRNINTRRGRWNINRTGS